MCGVLHTKETLHSYLIILTFRSVLKNKWISHIYMALLNINLGKHKSDKHVFFLLECICKGVISNDLPGTYK